MTTDGFTWGVATSAYQIEGAWDADGKGPSIWDRWSQAGRMADPGEVACDHYHRLDEDLDLMAALGVDAYRFSIAWTRVLPTGTGEVNAAGLGFYDRLVDGLLERGIEPVPTLYHWDLPQALQDEGGWEARSTADAFAEYAGVAAGHFAGRVRRWLTLNEPWVAAFLGHRDGVFPPGHQSWTAALAAAHHQLLGHGRAAVAIRDADPDAAVGLALDCRHPIPASDDPADLAATRHFDGFRNRWFFDPVFGKGYPDDMVAAYRDAGRLPADLVRPGDTDEIAAPIDHLGLNYYTSVRVRSGAEEYDIPEGPMGPDPAPGHTEMGWLVDAPSLGVFLRRVAEDWAPSSILITENGVSYSDGPGPEGTIDDQRRIDYLAAHVDEVLAARADGVPVDGYFVWSFMDNLEWVAGFSQRFGLVWVDHATQRRVPKASFDWYRERIAAGPR